MKKIFIAALLVLGISAGVGCKKDISIVGNWKGVDAKTFDKNGTQKDVDPAPEGTYLNLDKNGSVTMGDNVVGQVISGTYKYEGNKLTITAEAKSVIFEVVSLTKDRLELKTDAEDEKVAANECDSSDNNYASKAENNAPDANAPATAPATEGAATSDSGNAGNEAGDYIIVSFTR